MDRREFVGASVAGLTGAAAMTSSTREVGSGKWGVADAPFTLNYATHFGLFSASAGDDPIAELQFMHERGFRALEDNGMRDRPVAEQERIAREMSRLGMKMGVFVAHTIAWEAPNILSGKEDAREKFLAEIRASVEVAKRVNAKWMTVVPGHRSLRLDMDYQTAMLVELLKRASAILEPHGLVMVLEALNTLRDHPGQFLVHIPQAYAICKAVGSPACKILFDIYHQQISEGNLIPNFDAAWDEVAYVQIGDNPGRKEPTTGEINFANVFAHLHRKGYQGVLGMEHGKSKAGIEGERAVIAAYRQVDPPR